MILLIKLPTTREIDKVQSIRDSQCVSFGYSKAMGIENGFYCRYFNGVLFDKTAKILRKTKKKTIVVVHRGFVLFLLKSYIKG